MSEDNQVVKPSCLISRAGILTVAMLAWVAVAVAQPAQTDVLRVSELEVGFRLLYELKPAEACTQFAARQKAHPEDPLISAAFSASVITKPEHTQQWIRTM